MSGVVVVSMTEWRGDPALSAEDDGKRWNNQE